MAIPSRSEFLWTLLLTLAAASLASGLAAQPVISASSSSLEFGAWGTDAGPTALQTLTLTNAGDASLEFFFPWVAITGSAAPDFVRLAPFPPPTLGPGASHEIEIVFDPQAGGSRSANLIAVTNDPITPTLSIPLHGTGLERVHVDENGPNGDGSSWSQALTSVQDAIDLSVASGLPPVWVADGVYLEAITMSSGVELYGGFEGLGGLEESDLAQRDPINNRTAINGSTADAGAAAKHVVILDSVSDTRIDGFGITGGIANGTPPNDGGAGLFYIQSDSSNTLANCLIFENAANNGYGGGVQLEGSSPHITRCIFAANSANRMAGIAVLNDSDPLIDHCAFFGNYAFGFGGGVGVAVSSEAVVSNCVISGNGSGLSGGGIYALVNTAPEFINCTVRSNAPGTEGGGAWLNFNADCTFTNVIFVDNPAQAIHENDSESDPTVSFCLFSDNPDGDYWNENSTLLNGASAIETLAEASDIVDNPLALDIFGPRVTGTWTEAPDFNPATDRTLLVDANANFTPGALAGMSVCTDVPNRFESLITDNTATTIEVIGDVTQPPASTILGSPYAIQSYDLAAGSPAIDAGTSLGAPADDFFGTLRPQGLDFDIGAIEAQHAIDVSAESTDFGEWDIDDGPTADALIVISNTGTAPLTISSVALTGAGSGEFTIVSDTGESPLAAQSSREVHVAADPTVMGVASANLEIVSDDPATPLIQIGLSVVGIDQEIDVTPLSVSFGDRHVDFGASAPESVNITNLGSIDLTITSISYSGSTSHFSIVSDTGETTLPPQSSRTLEYAFDPSSEGIKIATVQISSDDTDEGLVEVTLSGRGVDEVIEADPTSISFSSRDIDDGPGGVREITLRNTGNIPLQVTSVALSGADADEFAISTDTGQSMLPPNATRTVGVTFDPDQTGSRSADLVVLSNDDANSPLSIPLSGTGTQQSVTLDPDPMLMGTQDIDEGPTGSVALVLTNSGPGALAISGVNLTGANASEFAIASDTGEETLPVGASREFAFTFDPEGEGPREAVFEVASEGPPISVTLQGTGIDQRIAITPSAINFGRWDIDDGGLVRTIEIRNEGTGPLHLSDPAFVLTGPSAALFAVSGELNATLIAAGASREVEIAFSPATLVACTASLEVSSDDTDLPSLFISLTGEGIQSTEDLVDMLLGVLALPASPEQYDINGDGLFDAADITSNVEDLN